MKSAWLPTSSVEMKTDRFSSYTSYAKAGLVFAATTVTYFLARTAGVLPQWLQWSGDEQDRALTLSDRTEVSVSDSEMLREDVLLPLSVKVSPPILADFSELKLESIAETDSEDISPTSRRLLQQGSGISIVQPIPDQWIQIDQLYRYPLDNVFSEGDYVLGATQTGPSSLPDWLSLQYSLLSTYPSGSGGSAYGVALSGSTVFVADWNAGLQVLNGSNPRNLTLLSTYPAGSGFARSVAVSGTTVFVANWVDLQVLDWSNPRNLTLLSTYPAGSGIAHGVAVSGTMVFVADHSAGLQVLDWSDPRNLILLGTYPASSGIAAGVAVSGTTVFVADGSVGLQVLDISNPLNPQLLSIYPTPGFAFDVAVSGTMVFVAGASAGLHVLDWSDPRSLTLLGTYAAAGSGLAYDVAVSGAIVFVADGSVGLHVLDWSNPRNLILLVTYPADFGGSAYGVAVSDFTVFMAKHIGGLQVLDMSRGLLTGTPSSNLAPGQQISVNVTTRDMTGTSLSAGVSFILTLDNFPYLLQTTVPDQSIFPGQVLSLPLNPHLFVNPSNFSLVVSLQLKGGGVKPSWLVLSPTPQLFSTYPMDLHPDSSVEVSGSLVFVVDGTAGLRVLDISNLSSPQLLSTYSTGGYARRVAASGTTVFVAYLSSLQVLDISNPLSPQLLSTYSTSPGLAVDVAVSGTTVFVTGEGAGLHVLDWSDPRNLILLDTYPADFGGSAYGVAVSGAMVFVANRGAGLQVLDWSNPRNLTLLSTYASSGASNDVAVLDSLVFVAGGEAGLKVIDASNPKNLTLLSTYPTGSAGDARGVAVSKTTVFVANHFAGLQVIDASNPRSLQLLTIYPASAQDVAVLSSTVFLANERAGGLRGLQVIDFSQQTLIATPSVLDIDNYDLQLIATDIFGGSVSVPFRIRVEGPPQIHEVIPLQYAKVGQAFNYFVPQGLITDPNFDPISFSAKIQGSPSLPSWLSFNGISAIFVGVPQEADVGNFTIVLSATDHIAGVLDTTFGLLVDHLPVVRQNIPPQVAGIGLRYQYTVPSTVFFEPDGHPLSYSAQQSNNFPLPSWLAFNTTSHQFEGQPNRTDAGSYQIEVTAKDPYHGQVKADFLLIVEDFPTVNQWPTVPLGGVGVPFSWEIPSNSFKDMDSDPLTYTARQQDGSLLPNWLSFNPQTLVFSGIPQSTDVRTLSLQLSAMDPSGGQVQQNFNLTVTYFPKPKVTLDKQLADIDQVYQYIFAADTFSQEDKAVLLYSAQQSSGLALPDWLYFNTTSRRLSGQPNITAAGHYDLEITATNPVGAQAKVAFSLIVKHFPEILQPMAPRIADINQPFSFFIPVDSFLDKDGESLTYTAQRKSGDSLPNWLTFHPQSALLSGVPLETDEGTLPLQVIATDPDGASVTSDLMIQVIHFPVVAHPQPAVIVRAGQSFHFSIAPDAFEDIDQVGLSYAAHTLPGWLTFDNRTLKFSGQAGASDIGSVPLTVLANDTRGASVSMDFKLQVRGDISPTVTEALPNQAAKVGQSFSFILPTNLFVDSNNNTLHYSAIQQGGLPLPEWLGFDNRSLHFLGTPGHGDTNFYAIRVLGINVIARSDEGQTSASFNVSVDGKSWGELVVSIVVPLVSFLTTLYAVYEARALCLNRRNQTRYTRIDHRAVIGENFSYEFDTPLEQIHRIQVGVPHTEERGCSRFFKPSYRPLPGGDRLPWWMEYDEHKNILRSKGRVPSGIDGHSLVVQAEGEAGIILEKFTLTVGQAEATAVPVAPVDDRDLENKEASVELHSSDSAEQQDQSREPVEIEMGPLSQPSSPSVPTDSTLSEFKETRLSVIPHPSMVAKDSPLMKGATATQQNQGSLTTENQEPAGDTGKDSRVCSQSSVSTSCLLQ
jgi:hypothetical protein